MPAPDLVGEGAHVLTSLERAGIGRPGVPLAAPGGRRVREPVQLRARLGSCSGAFSSSWSASRTRRTSRRWVETSRSSAARIRRPRRAGVVEGRRVADPGVRDQALDRRRARHHLLLGRRDTHRLAARRDRLVGREDLEPLDERAVLVCAPGRELGAEDLRATLEQPSKQREVLALGHALVASRATSSASSESIPRGRTARGCGRSGGCLGGPGSRRRCYTVPLQQTATSAAYGFMAAPPNRWYSKWRWFTPLPGPVADHRAGGHAASRSSRWA